MNDNEKIPKLEELITKKELQKSNNISKITDKIYLGDYEGTKDLDYFSKEGITHVLSIINDIPVEFSEKDNITHKLLNIKDEENSNLIKYFKECFEFIEKANKIFIHCACGISRSPTIVIAYLMWKTHCSYNDTFWFVKNRRKLISPNDGFVKQLKIFEDMIKKNNYDKDFELMEEKI